MIRKIQQFELSCDRCGQIASYVSSDSFDLAVKLANDLMWETENVAGNDEHVCTDCLMLELNA